MTLADILKRLREATGADREIDYALEEFFAGDLLARYGYKRLPGDEGWDTSEPAALATKLAPAQEFTNDVNYLLGRIKRDLPGAWIELSGPRKYLHIPTPVPNYWCARIDGWNYKSSVVGWGATPALALLIALLEALREQEQRKP